MKLDQEKSSKNSKLYKINRRTIFKPKSKENQIYITTRTPLNSYRLRALKLFEKFDQVDFIALGKATIKLCQLFCAIESTISDTWSIEWTSGQTKVVDDMIPEDEVNLKIYITS
jgi:hypothetical protein